jgi:hypothetical protein
MVQMRAISLVVSTVFVWAALAMGAEAASGTALGVNPDAHAQTGKDIRLLQIGSDIGIGDRVITDAKGLVQIQFSDQTRLVVGPNSSLVIEDYLLRNDNTPGKFAINALNGTFRFITGGARKDLYQINTPTGTIGVRGTAGDFWVSKELTKVLVFHGAMVLCNLQRKCVTLDSGCELGQYSGNDSQVIGNTDGINGEDRTALHAAFPLADGDAKLMHLFQVANARRCLNRPVEFNSNQFYNPFPPEDSDHDQPEDDQGGCYGLQGSEGSSCAG